MPAYEIEYNWIYNRYGRDGPAWADEKLPLRVRYYIQPDEPDVNVHFYLQVEEIWLRDISLEPGECGWTQEDEDDLSGWLLEGNYELGRRARDSGSGSQSEDAGTAAEAEGPQSGPNEDSGIAQDQPS